MGFSVGTCDLVLFPSSLAHMVEQTESQDTRISLSFNTFLKGLIGDEPTLTALHLGEPVDASQHRIIAPNKKDGRGSSSKYWTNTSHLKWEYMPNHQGMSNRLSHCIMSL